MIIGLGCCHLNESFDLLSCLNTFPEPGGFPASLLRHLASHFSVDRDYLSYEAINTAMM